MIPANPNPAYDALIEQISTTYESGRKQAVRQVQTKLLHTYWAIGQYIVEFEQDGHTKAIYGKKLIPTLAQDLSLRLGKGFGRVNLTQMRQLYLRYSNVNALSPNLSYSHYVELSNISDDLERSFYEQQSIRENWGLHELRRQKSSSLFLRLAASRDKEGVLALSKKGQSITNPDDLLRDPYVFEFLKIPEHHKYTEGELESRLMDNLQNFLLELGKGFTFVGRQYRITINNKHHRVDLVFYHRILRCFVLIDLKIKTVKHGDIGQMNMYMGYFASEENVEGDNPPIGIILSRDKDDLLVEYATYGMSSQLFVATYQTYLPDRDELQRQLQAIINED
jgi:predicted nuclease of restriction endonuclease-like (RecB) superfamily